MALFLFAACEADVSTGPVCGDGLRESPEACDDGNTASGDGCSAACQVELPPAVCGDGALGGDEQCDDGDTEDADGCAADCTTEAQLTANWTIQTAAGATATCPPTYDTAVVYSQPVDGTGAAVGQPMIDLFDCAAGTGTVYLPPDNYQVWVAITTATNSMTYAQTLSAFVDLTIADKTFTGQILTDGGYFQWDWLLKGETSNDTLTCAQAGAAGGVEIISTVSGDVTAFDDIFTCEDGTGITSGLPAGTYVISADALDADMVAIGTAPTQTNKVIQSPNKVTDLGVITIPITGL